MDSLTLNQFRFIDKDGKKWEPLAYVDSTPDENYVIRILEAHLKNCEGKWEGEGEGSWLMEYMNKFQDQRAELLKNALKVLKGEK